MTNVKQTIDGHNKAVLKMNNPDNKTQLDNGCNCKSIVYQATVSTNDNKPDQTYVGLTSNSFKTRFANHKTSFSYVKKKHATELSNCISGNLKIKMLTTRSSGKL